jgi:hypothetical protein
VTKRKPPRVGDDIDCGSGAGTTKPPPQDPTMAVDVYADTRPSVPDHGRAYLHCQKCLDEWNESFRGITSPKTYSRQQIATTDDGFQVWCTRHDCNVAVFHLRAVRKE